MKLSEKTTKALCATPRKPVEFRWPESRWIPRQDGTYQLDGTNERFKIRYVERNNRGFNVVAVVLDDPNRLMPLNVGPYQEEPIRVMRNGPEPEPEAVSEAEDARNSAKAREKEASKMALADALHAGAEQLRREAPEVGREVWQAQVRLNVARLKLSNRRGTLDMA